MFSNVYLMIYCDFDLALNVSYAVGEIPRLKTVVVPVA